MRLTVWVVLAGLIGSQAVQAADLEYWSMYSLLYKVHEKATVSIKPAFWFRDNISDFFYFKTYAGVDVAVNNYFSIAPYYAVNPKESAGEWKTTHLAHLDAILKYKIKNMKLSDRNRVEYFFTTEVWKYRNNLNLAHPVTIAGGKIVIAVSNEIFYDFNANELCEDRASIGGSIKIHKKVSLGLSCLLKIKKSGRNWVNTNVLVSSLGYSI